MFLDMKKAREADQMINLSGWYKLYLVMSLTLPIFSQKGILREIHFFQEVDLLLLLRKTKYSYIHYSRKLEQ